MREILFRGKRLDSGEWVDGSLHIEWGEARKDGSRNKDYRILGMRGECYYVDPDTVGQFTGLLDYFGNRIFEGDIVEGPCHSAWRHDTQRCVVAYGRYGFECRHHIDGLDSDYYKYKVLFSRKVEVIGNIHDNKELLDGSEV